MLLFLGLLLGLTWFTDDNCNFNRNPNCTTRYRRWFCPTPTAPPATAGGSPQPQRRHPLPQVVLPNTPKAPPATAGGSAQPPTASPAIAGGSAQPPNPTTRYRRWFCPTQPHHPLPQVVLPKLNRTTHYRRWFCPSSTAPPATAGGSALARAVLIWDRSGSACCHASRKSR